MFSQNVKISDRQLVALLLLDFFGTEMLFLPSNLAEIGGKSCWILLFCGTLAAAAFAPLLTLLGRREPTWTAVEWFRSMFGYAAGSILVLGLGFKLLLDGAIELRIFSEILHRTMLPKTPMFLLLFALLLLCLYTAQSGIETQGRTAEILAIPVFVPLLIFVVAAAFSVEKNYALPISLPEGKTLWKSLSAAQPLFQAMTFLLFIPPFLKNHKKSTKKVWYVGLFTVILFTIMTFLCLAVYGEDSLSHKLFAPLQLLERVGLSGMFFARQDLFLLWFWMVSVFLFLSGSLFFGGVFCQKLTGRKKRKGSIFVFAILLAVLALLPDTMEGACILRRTLSPWLGAVYLALFPLLFLLMYKKGGKKDV